jgi:hypothetical protein
MVNSSSFFKVFVFPVLLCSIFLMSCSSGFQTVMPMTPEKYETLGVAKGEATGALGILGTAYYFIPIGLNSRVESAYQNALQSVPGATALTDVTYQESWFWIGMVTVRKVSITGNGIKEVKE